MLNEKFLRIFEFYVDAIREIYFMKSFAEQMDINHDTTNYPRSNQSFPPK